jgi:hypothetical protein
MALTDEEQAALDALLAKQAQEADEAEPETVAEAVADATGESVAEVGAATAESVGDVAQTVAAVVAAEVGDAHQAENERLAQEADAAKVDAAIANMRADDAENEAAGVVASVAAGLDEQDDAPDVIVDEGSAAVIVDADEGANVTVEDSAPESKPHRYFQPLRRRGE